MWNVYFLLIIFSYFTYYNLYYELKISNIKQMILRTNKIDIEEIIHNFFCFGKKSPEN